MRLYVAFNFLILLLLTVSPVRCCRQPVSTCRIVVLQIIDHRFSVFGPCQPKISKRSIWRSSCRVPRLAASSLLPPLLVTVFSWSIRRLRCRHLDKNSYSKPFGVKYYLSYFKPWFFIVYYRNNQCSINYKKEK